jgi:hypothetical protein
MKMEQTQCSETLAFKLQTLVNHPEESIQHLCVNYQSTGKHCLQTVMLQVLFNNSDTLLKVI